jgi:hypothetical protein
LQSEIVTPPIRPDHRPRPLGRGAPPPSPTATVSGDNVQIEFLFFIGGGTGADGLSLTALDTTRMSSWLGGTGCGIGYGGGAACTTGAPRRCAKCSSTSTSTRGTAI